MIRSSRAKRVFLNYLQALRDRKILHKELEEIGNSKEFLELPNIEITRKLECKSYSHRLSQATFLRL
jgi:hypothetical protein